MPVEGRPLLFLAAMPSDQWEVCIWTHLSFAALLISFLLLYRWLASGCRISLAEVQGLLPSLAFLVSEPCALSEGYGYLPTVCQPTRRQNDEVDQFA